MPVPPSRQLYREFLAQPLRSQASHNPVHSQPGSFRAYLELVGEYRRAFLVIFIAACLTELLYLAVPVTTRHIIDAVLMNTRLAPADKARLLALIGGVLLVLLIAAQGIDFWRRFYTAIVNGRFVRTLRLQLFSHLMRLPLSKVHELKTGGIVSRLTSDAENLTGLLQMAIISPGVAFLRIAITFAILIYWHLPLALVASGFIPPLIYISLIYILRVRPVYRSVSNDRSAQDARTSEVFTGIRAVKAFGMQLAEKRRYNTVQGLMFRKNIFASLRESAVDGIWNFLIPVTSLLIMVIGGFFFLRGETTIGDLVAFQMYSGMLLYPVWRMVFSLSQIQKSMASLDRVLDMLSLEVEGNTGDLPMPARPREIRFEHVSFGYRQNQMVLRDISLVFRPSRIYAVIGESGIGKTTLMDLLCRFYQPQQGRITLNGVECERYELKAWREGISIVTQDAILFDGSVRENLLISSQPFSDAQLLRALRAADAQDFIDQLPLGLDTMIGERGFRLSGGQKHRLTLARALVKGAPVLVLDEATAHLDSLSEQKIRDQLDKLKKNRVVIMITHRLSTVKHADQIIVMSGGSVEAIGNHRDLLRRSRTYQRLWRAQ